MIIRKKPMPYLHHLHLFGGIIVASALNTFLASMIQAAEPDQRLFELRVYYAAEGKLEALHERFRQHTCRLFEKHGMENIGYWTPIENPESKLIYILAFPDQAARKASWQSFMADPEWQTAYRASEQQGKLVDRFESALFKATDYSPAIRPVSEGNRVFEMRIYKATSGNFANLHARFRDHTLRLFEKHGMTNVGYWTPVEDQKGWGDRFFYLLSHSSIDSAKASFDAFRNDPQWQSARQQSEEKAGGSLTEAQHGVLSEFILATDYSPIR
jgi:hypothetical protein